MAARQQKRVALQDRDLAMLSLPSQDQPRYYDSPPTSPPSSQSPPVAAYPTSLIRSTPKHEPGPITTSNRGHKLDPRAPFTHPLKLGHHSHHHAPPTTPLKRRKLNGFTVAPNLELVPRSDFTLKDSNRDDSGQPCPSFLPPPPQSPLDLILLPHIQHTFSTKNSTFHLLSESATTLIEQEGQLVKALTRVCTGLRGEGYEWRWPGDEQRERERRETRELREQVMEDERVERENLRKRERDRLNDLRRQERAEREQRLREEQEAKEIEEEEERERERARREQQERESEAQQSTVKPESDQPRTTLEPPAPGMVPPSTRTEDVEMTDSAPPTSFAAPPTSFAPPLDSSIVMPTPSSLPSLPLPAAPLPSPPPTTTAVADHQTPSTDPAAVAGRADSSPRLDSTNETTTTPLVGADPSSSSSSLPSTTIPTSQEPQGEATTTTTTVSQQEQEPVEETKMQGVESNSSSHDLTREKLEEKKEQEERGGGGGEGAIVDGGESLSAGVIKPVESDTINQDAAPTTTTGGGESGVTDSTRSQEERTSTTTMVGQGRVEPEPEPEPESEPRADAETGEEGQGARVEGEGEAEEEEAIEEEPTIRRSGRQTRATVGLRASQLLFEDGYLGHPSHQVGSGGTSQRGISYSPDPYSLGGGGGGGGEVEADTPTSTTATTTMTTANRKQQGAQTGAEEDSSNEDNHSAPEELPLVPSEDIPEYAHRLVDPESYVKSLFVSDGPVELEKCVVVNQPGGGPSAGVGPSGNGAGVSGTGVMETLSCNEQEALVHDCLTDLHRFLSDTIEYRNRLSEIRDGILEVERRRKGMWKVVRTVALDWLEEEAAGGAIAGGAGGAGGANASLNGNVGASAGIYEGYE